MDGDQVAAFDDFSGFAAELSLHHMRATVGAANRYGQALAIFNQGLTIEK